MEPKRLYEALLFPHESHQRSPDPGPFRDHRSYKRQLQLEFRRKCVYCREADGLKGYEAFGVDHYLARSRADDPVAAAAWSNLFYACNVCNTWKGKRVSTPELFLPNPCLESPMAEHLQYRDDKDSDVDVYSPHGEWLAELLHLSERRERRQFILSTLAKYLRDHIELSADRKMIEERIKTAESGADPDLLRDLQDTIDDLESVGRKIELLTGEPVLPEQATP